MNNKSLEMSIKANCMRILEILEERDLEKLKNERKSQWDYNRIPECVELDQRMHQLRKDTLKAHSILYPKGGR